MQKVNRRRFRPVSEPLECRTLLSTAQLTSPHTSRVISSQSSPQATPAAAKTSVTPSHFTSTTTSKSALTAAAANASTSTLLTYDFNASNPWPLMSATTSNGGSAALIWGGVGTIDTEGGTTPSGALRLTATPPTSGAWSSTLSSGQLVVSNTVTNLGLLTLAFNLSASQANPVTLIIYSYNAQGQQTGGQATTIYPATTYYNQKFSVDLSTMTPFGTGTFDPTSPFVSFNLQINSQAGWSAATACQLRLDNVNYAKPAYYVSATGNNSNNGLTSATAFATPEKAVSVSKPGDIIEVMTGTYTITSAGTNSIKFAAGGTAADWITLKNYPGQSPVIQSEWWNAILIGNGSSTAIATTPAIAYVEVRGLTVRGDADYVQTKYPTLINQPVPQTNGNGISIDGRYETNHPHDIRFANNLVEYCSAGGFGAGEADRVQIEDNVSLNNSWWTIYATSGISILSAYNFDGTSNVYTRLVYGNVAEGNQCFEKWQALNPPAISDGNGIIIDVNHNTGDLPNSVTAGRTLVENNLSYNNGGGGLHVVGANHVDVINNTAYMNSASPALEYAEADSIDGNDDNFFNNILVAPTAPQSQLPAGAEPVTVVKNGTGDTFKNNIYYGGNITPKLGTGDKIADPQFVLPSINPTTADFRLLATSPAINDGTTLHAPSVDINSNTRYAAPDAGAYEFIPTAPTSVALAAASDTGVPGDNKTKLNNSAAASALSFIVTGTVAGATVQLYAGTTLIGSANAAGTTTTVTTNGTAILPDGGNSITAAQAFASAPSASSPALVITIDTTSPTLVGTPVINLASTLPASRSQIRTITWMSSEPMLASLSSFILTNRDTGVTVNLSSRSISISGNSVTLNLDNYGVDTDSNLFLADGNYQLTLSPAVTDQAGNSLDANGDGTPGETANFDFHKLLGDFNGDRWVSNADYLLWKADYNQPVSSSVDSAFDLDGNGSVALPDYTLWNKQYNRRLPLLSDGLIFTS